MGMSGHSLPVGSPGVQGGGKMQQKAWPPVGVMPPHPGPFVPPPQHVLPMPHPMVPPAQMPMAPQIPGQMPLAQPVNPLAQAIMAKGV
jgi:hypothetical protein